MSTYIQESSLTVIWSPSKEGKVQQHCEQLHMKGLVANALYTALYRPEYEEAIFSFAIFHTLFTSLAVTVIGSWGMLASYLNLFSM